MSARWFSFLPIALAATAAAVLSIACPGLPPAGVAIAATPAPAASTPPPAPPTPPPAPPTPLPLYTQSSASTVKCTAPDVVVYVDTVVNVYYTADQAGYTSKPDQGGFACKSAAVVHGYAQALNAIPIKGPTGNLTVYPTVADAQKSPPQGCGNNPYTDPVVWVQATAKNWASAAFYRLDDPGVGNGFGMYTCYSQAIGGGIKPYLTFRTDPSKMVCPNQYNTAVWVDNSAGGNFYMPDQAGFNAKPGKGGYLCKFEAIELGFKQHVDALTTSATTAAGVKCTPPDQVVYVNVQSHQSIPVDQVSILGQSNGVYACLHDAISHGNPLYFPTYAGGTPNAELSALQLCKGDVAWFTPNPNPIQYFGPGSKGYASGSGYYSCAVYASLIGAKPASAADAAAFACQQLNAKPTNWLSVKLTDGRTCTYDLDITKVGPAQCGTATPDAWSFQYGSSTDRLLSSQMTAASFAAYGNNDWATNSTNPVPLFCNQVLVTIGKHLGVSGGSTGCHNFGNPGPARFAVVQLKNGTTCSYDLDKTKVTPADCSPSDTLTFQYDSGTDKLFLSAMSDVQYSYGGLTDQFGQTVSNLLPGSAPGNFACDISKVIARAQQVAAGPTGPAPNCQQLGATPKSWLKLQLSGSKTCTYDLDKTTLNDTSGSNGCTSDPLATYLIAYGGVTDKVPAQWIKTASFSSDRFQHQFQVDQYQNPGVALGNQGALCQLYNFTLLVANGTIKPPPSLGYSCQQLASTPQAWLKLQLSDGRTCTYDMKTTKLGLVSGSACSSGTFAMKYGGSTDTIPGGFISSASFNVQSMMNTGYGPGGPEQDLSKPSRIEYVMCALFALGWAN